jgi:pyruvate dehydrogenase kinase 2/3/4
MQKLPYVVVSNPHISIVYELYYKAFEKFRKVPEILSLSDNDRYCDILRDTLAEHLTVIPNLAMGVLECQGLVEPDEMDRFMNTMLRAVRLASCYDVVLPLTLRPENISSSDRRAASCLDRNI